MVRYWCRSGRRRIYRSKTVFSSKEVEPEYTTYTITEMASLKLDGQVSFLDTRDIFFDPSLEKLPK